VQIYVGEISSVKNRAKLLNFLLIFFYFGIIFAYTCGNLFNFKTFNIIYGSIPIIFAFGFQFLPESPVHLQNKRKYEEAERVSKILGLPGVAANPETVALRKIAPKNVQKTLLELLKIKATRKATIIMNLQFFFFQMSGTNAVNFYAQTIFTEAGLKSNAGVGSIINVLVLTISAFVAVLYTRKFGRKMMLFTFNSLISISLVGIGTYFNLKSQNYDVENFGWLLVVFMCVNSISFCLGMCSVSLKIKKNCSSYSVTCLSYSGNILSPGRTVHNRSEKDYSATGTSRQSRHRF
jgi:MFS family permease